MRPKWITAEQTIARDCEQAAGVAPIVCATIAIATAVAFRVPAQAAAVCADTRIGARG